jgi:pyruvate-ferredoxin/flavodoxin oxidoreductase
MKRGSKAVKKSKRRLVALDGNEAVARVAYPLSEVVAIYPITPSSGMGEMADAWAAARRPNLWDSVPRVVEMQSEGGAAGAIHGSTTVGALTTTFTASQGLLLMIPNLYKVAGELSPLVLHVAARSVAAQALSIFGDHSDVMAVRQTGCALLSSNSVQEAQDLALVAHAASLASRLPFIHFFDGFRTSHEISRIELLEDGDLKALIDSSLIREHRARGLDPERPTMRGTAQNPDVFFQARETVNKYYEDAPALVQRAMDKLAKRTGRAYRIFEYYGAEDAERAIVMMGSGCGAAEEAVDALNRAGEKVGLLKVRLYRPFASEAFLEALPETVRRLAVLDRTKEPGAPGEPLFLDVVSALSRAPERGIQTIGGRYGLSSKEFTPGMVAAVFSELNSTAPKNGFTIGIRDDVTHASLDWDETYSTEHPETTKALFFGLGSDGTVSANKNSIKIIAEETGLYAQGYFVYDSKKSGSRTVSHLRFGPKPIRGSYLIDKADFLACHQESFLSTTDILAHAAPGGTFLLNTTASPSEAFSRLPRESQKRMRALKLKFYVVDAYRVAKEAGLGRRINTVMQACFFHLTGLVPDWNERVKAAIEKSYSRAGREVLEKNFRAVDSAVEHLGRARVSKTDVSRRVIKPPVPKEAPEFVRAVTGPILEGKGDSLPVSALPADGTYPTATSRWEKRGIAVEIPVWDERWCIQCNKCSLVCPHAAIRTKAYPQKALSGAPKTLKSVEWRGRDLPAGTRYTVQVAPDDCTGCGLCVEVCPAKNKEETKYKAINMRSFDENREGERKSWSFFEGIPDPAPGTVDVESVKGSQLKRPLFEFSGACAGCGETPYLKLLTQLFGDRMAVANATGCSSIYGGNLPTTPWAQTADGRGPAWSNSLFEDNAEFGLGFREAFDAQRDLAARLLTKSGQRVGAPAGLIQDILDSEQATDAEISEQRVRIGKLRKHLKKSDAKAARDLEAVIDSLVRKSVWIVGGDGWAYDIGYGGLDHVLASGKDVNVIVLDTEVYSNTGGQASKATPRGAVAKFAASGKPTARKDLVALAMSYGSIYVARVAMGASDAQTVKAFNEAESYRGPSLVVAYSQCIAHGIDMRQGMRQQKLAVDTGYWPLLRFDPRREAQGLDPLQIDSKRRTDRLEDYIYNETRYRMLSISRPQEAKRLLALAKEDIERRWRALTGGGRGS